MRCSNNLGFLRFVFCLMLVACAAEDEAAPAPPWVDAVQSPTSRTTVELRGTAEFGAVVRVSGSADPTPPETIADPYSATWRLPVTLVPRAGAATPVALEVTATDGAGNASEPAAVVINYAPVGADNTVLRLALLESIISADEGILIAEADLIPEFDAGGRSLTFTIEEYDGTAPSAQTIRTDPEGHATAIFEGMTTAGTGVVRVSLDESPEVEAVRSLVVLGGDPSEVELTLDPPNPVTAGTTVRASVTILDRSANDLGLDVVVSTHAPGALVVENEIRGIEKAGTYTVIAEVEGTKFLAAPATLRIVAGAPDRIALTLSTGELIAGASLSASARVEDEFGNDTGEAVTLETDAGTLPGPLTTSGTFSVTASAAGVSNATAALVVLPGPAAEVTLNAPATVIAGAAVPLEVTVQDGFGNLNPTAPVVLSSNSADAWFVGDAAFFPRTGIFSVSAAVLGTLLVGEATVTVEAASAALVSLSLSSDEVAAGSIVVADARVLDAFGNQVPEATLDLASDAGSFVGDSLTPTATGSFTVSASFGALSADRPLAVVASQPAAVDLVVTPTSVGAGEVASYTVTVTDQFGNPTTAPVEITTTAPGARVVGETLTGLEQAGTWEVRARLAAPRLDGSMIEDTQSIVVSTGTAAIVTLTVEPDPVNAGQPAQASIRVTDAFGNEMVGAVTLSSSSAGPLTSIDQTADTITIRDTGTFTITATLDGDPSVFDGELLTVVDFDAPAVELTSPATAITLVPGAALPVIANATDNADIASLRIYTAGPLFLQTAQSFPGGDDLSVSFSSNLIVPTTIQFAQLTLFAEAVDSGGRVSLDAGPVVTIDAAGALAVAPGFSASTVALGGLLINPEELDVTAAGELFVANNGGNNLLRISPTGAVSVFLVGTGSNPFNSPEGLALDEAGGFAYVSVTGPSGRHIERAALANGARTAISSTLSGARGLHFFVAGADRDIYAARDGANTAVRIDIDAAGFPSGADGTFTFGANLDTPWDVAANATGTTLFATNRGTDDLWSCALNAGRSACVAASEVLQFDAADGLNGPRSLALLPQEDGLLVANEGSSEVLFLCFSGTVGVLAGLDTPRGLAVRGTTEVYVTDRGTEAVYRIAGDLNGLCP